MKKPLIIFDIDRTIYDGTVGEDFILSLCNHNLIDSKILTLLGLELLEYQTSISNYQTAVKNVLTLLDKELKGIEKSKIEKEANNFLKSNHYKFYDYIYEISKIFGTRYDFLLLSLEPDFLVKEIAKSLSIKNFIGNEFLGKKTFSGDSKILTSKKELFENSIFSKNEVLAYFGDSENDIEMIEKAHMKFVINPTPKLIEYMKSNSEIQLITEKTAYQIFSKTLFQRENKRSF